MALIYCRWSFSDQLMANFPKSVLMKNKLIYILNGLRLSAFLQFLNDSFKQKSHRTNHTFVWQITKVTQSTRKPCHHYYCYLHHTTTVTLHTTSLINPKRQGRAGQGRARQGKAGQGRAGQGMAGQGRAGQGRAGQGKAETARNTVNQTKTNWTDRTKNTQDNHR